MTKLWSAVFLLLCADIVSASSCDWRVSQVTNINPVAIVRHGQSSMWTGVLLSDWVDPVTGTKYKAGFAPEWIWSYYLDASAWIINVHGVAMSADYGFSSLSNSIVGSGAWRITREASCINPKEDIEVTMSHGFHANAFLCTDEKMEVLGQLKFWMVQTKSNRHPGAVFSQAAGGVSLDDDYSSSTSNVSVTLGGAKFSVPAGTGGSNSKTDDPHSMDVGNRGTSIEHYYTFTQASLTMDLDTWDKCEGKIHKTMWNVRIQCTCDGHCKRKELVTAVNFTMND